MNRKVKLKKEYIIEDCYDGNYKIKNADKIIKKEKDRVIYLFSIYQIIEKMLYFALFPKEKINEDADLKGIDRLEYVKRKFNKNTLGDLINEYNTKFPDDDFKLKDDLIDIKNQRNNFMHTFFIYIAYCDKKDALKIARSFLNDYIKNAEIILDIKIPKILPKNENV